MSDQPDDPRDEVLLQLFAKVDIAAMGVLYRRRRSFVLAQVARYIRNRPDQEDLAQEVWIRVMTNAARFHDYGEGSFRAWVSVIARNVCMSYLARQAFIVIGPIRILDDANFDFIESVGDERFSPEAESSFRFELSPALSTCVRLLPDPLKLIFWLRQVKEMGTEEVAELLNCAVGTVSNAYQKALRTLQWCMKRNGFRLSDPNVTWSRVEPGLEVDLTGSPVETASYDLIVWCDDPVRRRSNVVVAFEAGPLLGSFDLCLNRETASHVLYISKRLTGPSYAVFSSGPICLSARFK